MEMKVWLGAYDPENVIDAHPFASETDAKQYFEQQVKEYLEGSENVTDPTFEWREEPQPWEGIFALYANGERQPVMIWEADIDTYQTAMEGR